MSRERPNLTGWLFAGPWFIGFVALTLYPFAASFYVSFCRYDLLTPPRYVGGENYARLADELIHGGRFGQALWNTVYYAALSVPLSILLGLSLAVMLAWKARGQAVYRTLLFLPSVVPVVAATALWMWLLDPREGLVNYTLSLFGVTGNDWFKSPREFLFSGHAGSKDGLVMMSLWGVGNFMVIYLAALGDVPRSLYEAAELDGAGPIRRFVHITLPMISPVIFFNLVMGLIQAVQAFTQVYLVSDGQGSPAGSALLLSLHLFLAGFKELDMGYASAMAWLLFVFVLAATVALFQTSRRWVFYQGGRR